jgi:predicted AAA+ superfamily ATPase
MPGAIPLRAGLAPEPSEPLETKTLWGTYAFSLDAKEMKNRAAQYVSPYTRQKNECG